MKLEHLAWMGFSDNLVYTVQKGKNTREDADKVMWYRIKRWNYVRRGINEAGAFSAWIALATSYCCIFP